MAWPSPRITRGIDAQLSKDRKAALSREAIEGLLHGPGYLFVALTDDGVVLSGIRTVHGPVNRLTQLHGDLRRKRPRRDPPWNDPERWPEYEWHDFDAEQTIEPEVFGDVLSATENDERLMGAYGHSGNDRNLCAEGESDEAAPVSELDAVALPPRSEHFIVTTRVVDEDPVAAEDLLRITGPGFDCASAFQQRTDAGNPKQELVEECVDGFVFTSFAPPCGQENRDVRRHLTSRMVADHEERPGVW